MCKDLKNNEKREIANLILEQKKLNYGLLSKESANAFAQLGEIFYKQGYNKDAKLYYNRCLEI